MYELKGFMSMPALADDRKNVIATFGEFSTYSQTFSRDLRNYKIIEQPDVELFVMHCVDEMLNRATPTASFRANVLGFGQWIFQQLMAENIPQEKNKANFIKAIQAEFPLMEKVEIGTILDDKEHAGRSCPDYVTWRQVDGINLYQLTIWFADNAFRTQYDEYEIVLIPPCEDINDLINDKLVVNNIISQTTKTDLVEKIQDIVDDLPNTALYGYKLTWHDPSDFEAVLPTDWTAIIWGAAGNDLDNIKDTIRDYIDNNSDYPKWNEIYPDLYSETEFSFFPMWGSLALQANALQVGIYASSVKNSELRETAKMFLPSGYTQSGKTGDAYLEDHLFNGVAFYRSLAFGQLGNPNNKDEIRDLNVLYPDINFALDTLSNDFGRMSIETQGLSREFNAALDIAYTYQPANKVPSKYSRLIRRGMHFIAFQYEDYTYAILTHFSYTKAMSELLD